MPIGIGLGLSPVLGGSSRAYPDGVTVGVGSYITCPDAAALDITGDIDLRARVASAARTPASTYAW